MHNIWIITKVILKRLFQKPSNIFLHLMVPIATSIGLFLLIGLSSGSELHLAIVDQDQSITSEKIIQTLNSKEGFNTYTIPSDTLQDDILNKKFTLGIVIPSNFEKQLMDNQTPLIEIISLQQSENHQWISPIVNEEVQRFRTLALSVDTLTEYHNLIAKIDSGVVFDSISVVDHSIEKNGLIRTFGNYILFLMISTFLIAFRIIDEKNKGTYYRIGMTSNHPRIYILANILAGTLIAMIQIGLVLTGLKFIGVEFYASIGAVYLVLVTFALCAISLSVFIAVSSKNIQVANSTIGFILSPSCMIAGCLWPTEFMPAFLQKIAYLMPQRWTLDAIELLQRNKSWIDVVPNLLVVSGFTLLFFLFTVYKLKSEDYIY